MSTVTTLDKLTVLSHASNILAKRWTAAGALVPYASPKNFALRSVEVDGIRSLSRLLTDLAARSRDCVIRGRYQGVAVQLANNPGEPYERGKVLRRKNCFEDQPLHSVLIDVDGYAPLTADPVAEPCAAIEEFIECSLPLAFRGVSYHWQLSSSAGHPKYAGVLKAHVWFWLAKPATSAALRAWARAINLEADKALFDPIQVHYTAGPVFDPGVVDPVPVRQGFVEKCCDEVELDIEDVPAVERPSRQQRHLAALESDPVVRALDEAGMLKGGSTGDALHIVCPFEDEHTTAGSDSSTVYWPPHTGHYAQGHFDCKHEHCIDRTDADFIAKLGVVSDAGDDFDAVDEQGGEARTNSFQLASMRAREPIAPDIVQGVMPDAELGIIYGPSGSGKSFAAIDLGYHLARGEPWRGRKVKQRTVFYVAAEGAGGVRRRTRAYAQHHGLGDDVPFFTREVPINLFEKKGWVRAAEDVSALLQGEQRGVIFVDTLARSIPGAEENSARDIGTVVSNCQNLSRATGCLVVLVAHAGKQEENGVRGSSALRAAADFEIAVKRLTDRLRCLTLTKAKDDVDGAVFAFSLSSVEIGVDTDGDPVSSAVAVPESGAPPAAVKKPRSQVVAQILAACDALAEFESDGMADVERVVDRVLEVNPEAGAGRRANIRRMINDPGQSAFFYVRDGRMAAQTAQNRSD